MKKYNKYLPLALGLGFLMLALVAFIKGQPQSRDKRVYEQLKPYIPYKIEKKIGGLRIRNTKTDEKIEPSNIEVYNVLDNLEKDWGEKHLQREQNTLIIVDDNNKTIKTITLKNDHEKAYIHNFFGL